MHMWLHKNNLVLKYSLFHKKKNLSYEIWNYFNFLFLIKPQPFNKRGNPYATGKTFTPGLFIQDTWAAGVEDEVCSIAKTMILVLECPHLLVLPCLHLIANTEKRTELSWTVNWDEYKQVAKYLHLSGYACNKSHKWAQFW